MDRQLLRRRPPAALPHLRSRDAPDPLVAVQRRPFHRALGVDHAGWRPAGHRAVRHRNRAALPDRGARPHRQAGQRAPIRREHPHWRSRGEAARADAGEPDAPPWEVSGSGIDADPGREILAAALSPNGRRLAWIERPNPQPGPPTDETGRQAQPLPRIGAMIKGEQFAEYRGPPQEGIAQAVAINDDGVVASVQAPVGQSGLDNSKILKLSTGGAAVDIPAEDGGVKCLAFSPGGDHLVWGTTTGVLSRWTWRKPQSKPRRLARDDDADGASRRAVTACAIADDGDVAAGYIDGAVLHFPVEPAVRAGAPFQADAIHRPHRPPRLPLPGGYQGRAHRSAGESAPAGRARRLAAQQLRSSRAAGPVDARLGPDASRAGAQHRRVGRMLSERRRSPRSGHGRPTPAVNKRVDARRRRPASSASAWSPRRAAAGTPARPAATAANRRMRSSTARSTRRPPRAHGGWTTRTSRAASASSSTSGAGSCPRAISGVASCPTTPSGSRRRPTAP